MSGEEWPSREAVERAVTMLQARHCPVLHEDVRAVLREIRPIMERVRTVTDPHAIEPGDVVQLDPGSEMGKAYGPQLVVVSTVAAWGVQGYFVHVGPGGRGDFGCAYLRIKHGSFVRIGKAEWAAK